MPPVASIFERPDRWDAAFDPNMTDSGVDLLLGIPPFNNMAPDKFPKRTPLREILRNDTKIRRFREGELIVRQGDYGTSAFLILSGSCRVVLSPDLPREILGRKPPQKRGILRTFAQLWAGLKPAESFRREELKQVEGVGARQNDNDEVRIFLQDLPRVLDTHRTGELSAGDFFGEIAALSRMPRTSTIFAAGAETVLLEIRWQGLRDLMRFDDALRNHIEQIYRTRALATFLVATPLFSHLNEAQINEVSRHVEFATYGDYDWSGDYKRLLRSGEARAEKEPLIVRENDYPNGVVLVRAGFARVTKQFGSGERTKNYLGAGACFGLDEIAHNFKNPQHPVAFQHTLRAIGYTHLLIVPTRVMEELVLPTLPAKLFPPPVEPVDSVEADETQRTVNRGRIDRDQLEFLTANRFFNGTAAMVIDLERCTRCDDCVRACAMTHDNNPRFRRHGPSMGRLMIANSCMHCVDPVCMIGCPTGAIHRETFQGQVVINPTTCIGCKACANNCPYEAIRMVDIRNESGELIVDEEFKPISKATKCDLCVENYGGPACQRACPHGALERMSLTDLEAMEKWVNR